MTLGYQEFRRNSFHTLISAAALVITLVGTLGPSAAADSPPDPTCTPGVDCPANWPWHP